MLNKGEDRTLAHSLVRVFLDAADCPPGEAWNPARQVCNWCAKGTFKNADNTSCIACPIGESTDNVGATSIDECYAGRSASVVTVFHFSYFIAEYHYMCINKQEK